MTVLGENPKSHIISIFRFVALINNDFEQPNVKSQLLNMPASITDVIDFNFNNRNTFCKNEQPHIENFQFSTIPISSTHESTHSTYTKRKQCHTGNPHMYMVIMELLERWNGFSKRVDSLAYVYPILSTSLSVMLTPSYKKCQLV